MELVKLSSKKRRKKKNLKQFLIDRQLLCKPFLLLCFLEMRAPGRYVHAIFFCLVTSKIKILSTHCFVSYTLMDYKMLHPLMNLVFFIFSKKVKINFLRTSYITFLLLVFFVSSVTLKSILKVAPLGICLTQK